MKKGLEIWLTHTTIYMYKSNPICFNVWDGEPLVPLDAEFKLSYYSTQYVDNLKIARHEILKSPDK